jgi:hypothetical protein
MIRKEYCKERNILNIELTGIIGLVEILKYCEEFALDKALPRSLKILEDTTNAEFDFCIEDVDLINDTIANLITNFQCINHALLGGEPMGTAYGIMRNYTNNIDNYFTKVFTTEKGAIGWLLKS